MNPLLDALGAGRPLPSNDPCHKLLGDLQDDDLEGPEGEPRAWMDGLAKGAPPGTMKGDGRGALLKELNY